MAGSVYFVTALSDPLKVRERINTFIPADDCYDLADDKWMVVFDGPANDLAEQAGIRSISVIANGLVLPVTTYSGRAPSTLWDWLRDKGA